MPSLNNDGIRYIKISRIDKNGVDQTPTLQSLNKITIPYSTGDITYTVINITERLTFFLYYVNLAGVEWDDRAEIKYDFTGSILNSSKRYQTTQDMSGAPDLYIKFPIISSSNDNLNFLNLGPSTNFDNNNSLNTYRLLTYPQETLQINFSGSVMFEPFTSGFGVSSEVALVLLKKDGVEPILLQSSPYSIPSSKQSFTLNKTLPITSSFHISASLSSSLQPGDSLFAALGAFPTSGNEQVTASFTSDTTFTISSSNATGQQVGLVAEPYFGSNDFNRALDCQPLLNNAERVRRHNLYQDIDYSAGVNEPVNFDLLISGSATRAEVQFSNYTTRRHIIPRYIGSKSTSQELNTWTEGDTGTYGKTPTVESLKTVVAYCDFIGGWPPERMNASTAHILYIIDQDGNIGIPNTSENSLSNVQGAFQTGERFRISSETIGSGEATPFRTVIRGGQRLEPILSTQSGSVPGAQWTEIELVDIQATSGSAVGDFQNTGYVAETINSGGTPSYFKTQRIRLTPNQDSGYSYITTNVTGPNNEKYSYYTVPLGAIQENITLNFTVNLDIGWIWFLNSPFPSDITLGVILKRNNDTVGLTQIEIGFNKDVIPTAFGTFTLLATIPTTTLSIPASELSENDQISIEIQADPGNGAFHPSFPGITILDQSNYSITQNPIPTSLIIPSETTNSDIWGYYDKTNYPNIITSSDDVSGSLGTLYGDLNVRQQSVPNSGLNPIALPWSIKYGDEFRFEGDERFTYMVKKVYGPNEGAGSRITPTGSIEVQFDKNLPISASFDAFNLDHFLIRRYVDDASQVIMEGFKPENSTGPFIITPEYVVPKMNKKVDEYITILTEKGLL